MQDHSSRSPGARLTCESLRIKTGLSKRETEREGEGEGERGSMNSSADSLDQAYCFDTRLVRLEAENFSDLTSLFLSFLPSFLPSLPRAIVFRWGVIAVVYLHRAVACFDNEGH
jgi:hypothetical protein